MRTFGRVIAALAAALAGVATASLLHGVSHIVDHGLGGRAIDPWATRLIGIVTLLGFFAAVSARRARVG
jgi:hypothetical protein